MSAHVLAVVSAHGYGHFAQTALVLEVLHRLDPSIRFSLRTSLPEELVSARLPMPVSVIRETADFGMLMDSALDVRLEDSFAAYQEWHADWPERVAGEAERLEAIGPDLILANVPYLTLAAAAEVGIPAYGFCSLNWADIFWDYFSDWPGAEPIYRQMLAAYNSAQMFFQPEPGMAMPGFHNLRRVGPVAAVGRDRRDWFEREFDLAGKRLVLVVPGGIATAIAIDAWPCLDDVCWLPAWPVNSRRQDILPVAATGLPFTEVLASCDVVLTKPGYGTVAEAVCNGKAVLFTRRGDWAEEPFIVDWLLRHGRAQAISRQQFFTGHIETELNDVLARPPAEPVRATGAGAVARCLCQALARKRLE